MSQLQVLMVLIPALPLAATLIVAMFGKRVLGEKSHLPVAIAIGGSFLLSLGLLIDVKSHTDGRATAEAGAAGSQIGFEQTLTLWRWVSVPDAMQITPRDATAVASQPANFSIDVTLRADPLTAIMLCMVTFVSFLVVVYSSGYMHDDPGYARFFTYISLFVFSMTMLVSVSNFVLLYVFWEAVGACSYLLIGFWFQKPAAAAAGKKAFLVNRIGDFGFALGLFLIWTTYGTLNFHDTPDVPGSLPGVLGQHYLASPTLYVGGGIGLAIGLLLMTGACGKSAQFPLHVWLPDAMEGPTPVSALIHAATMVTAGVYMVARCTPLYTVSVDAQHVVAIIGGFTALLAGSIAVTQTDLKRILAYSTVSQLGYMFLSLGTGSIVGIVAGMFHLFTHAFFKALLFLGAGSVMHAMGGVIDIRRFGGLRRIMPITNWTFLIGCLALAGVVPFSGFWSKDAILAAVHERAQSSEEQAIVTSWLSDAALYKTLYYSAIVTAGLTAFYTFRAYFSTFFGETEVPSEAGHHAHESPASMTIPLIILAVCAAVVGGYFEWTHGFADFLEKTPQLAYRVTAPDAAVHGSEAGSAETEIMITSTIIALGGIAIAAFLYLGSKKQVDALARLLSPLYWLSFGKFFFDQIYNALIVRPLLMLAQVAYWFDRWVVDELVNLVGATPAAIGSILRPLQGGLVQRYALLMILGMLILIGTLLL